jgi:hypothetical protein
MRPTNRIALSIAALAFVLSACGEATATPDTASDSATTTTVVSDPDGPEVLPIVDRADGDITLPLDEGVTYGSEGLGVTFDAADRWYVQVHTPYALTLAQPTSTGPGDREVVVQRATSLVDPGYLSFPLLDAIDPEEDLWPVEDLDGWLAAADALSPSPASTTTVGDTESVRFSLDAAIPYCGEDLRCDTPIAIDESAGPVDREDHQPILSVGNGTTTNLWWVPQDDSTALVVKASGTDPELIAAAEALVSSIEFDNS